MRTEVAATADLIMAAELSRGVDLQRLPALRRILELETQPRGARRPAGATDANTAGDGLVPNRRSQRDGRRGRDPGIGR